MGSNVYTSEWWCTPVMFESGHLESESGKNKGGFGVRWIWIQGAWIWIRIVRIRTLLMYTDNDRHTISRSGLVGDNNYPLSTEILFSM